MPEKPGAKEPLLAMQFIEKPLKGTEPPRCVDGRQDPNSSEGPQILGGSLHPLVIFAIAKGLDFDKYFLKRGLNKLRKEGYALGIHRGAHQERGKGISDCGFADRLRDIMATAINQADEIKQRLTSLYRDNNINPFSLEGTYRILDKYSPEKVKLFGETLITTAEQLGALSETVQGNHNEKVAFVNLKESVTFDTRTADLQNRQAFNLDLPVARRQGESLGVDPLLARDLSLILYQATEMVLVESKGKPPLPVIIHK